MGMSKESKANFDRMVDVFGASDGGCDLVKFKAGLEELDAKASQGDEASKEILLVFSRFRRLVDILTTLPKGALLTKEKG